MQQLDFSVALTQADVTRQLQPLETSADLWKRRQYPLSDEEKLLCQCKMGELCWLATVSRPDICARLAQLASKVNDLQGSDIYRINAPIKTVEAEQPPAALNASSSFPLSPAGVGARGRRRSNGGRVRSGALSLVGWSGAAFGDLSRNGKCRLGYLIGIASSSPPGPCQVLQRASKFTRKLVKSSLGGRFMRPAR